MVCERHSATQSIFESMNLQEGKSFFFAYLFVWMQNTNEQNQTQKHVDCLQCSKRCLLLLSGKSFTSIMTVQVCPLTENSNTYGIKCSPPQQKLLHKLFQECIKIQKLELLCLSPKPFMSGNYGLQGRGILVFWCLNNTVDKMCTERVISCPPFYLIST